MLLYFARKYAGAYVLMKEAQIYDPLSTRCLSFLEDLAAYRNQQLQRGAALTVLASFAQQNNVQIREDPLIAI